MFSTDLFLILVKQLNATADHETSRTEWQRFYDLSTITTLTFEPSYVNWATVQLNRTFRYLPGRFATGRQRSSYKVTNFQTAGKTTRYSKSSMNRSCIKTLDAEPCYTEIENVWPTKAERDW